ncbi:hypothetical protein DY000_02023499 [Brassica cretica]|uniref:Arabidopsis retrotransposon Orf1 C-terminal domain-containing protein n=1 Tax=Brassica cretica TaxID=69181 RepID=A0ABQ7E8Q3_BRACR|nr:hypothetical protein DY000_02023499 [Brassica cretica]
MSSRRSSRSRQSGSSRISDDQISDLVTKLQHLIPELRRRRSDKRGQEVAPRLESWMMVWRGEMQRGLTLARQIKSGHNTIGAGCGREVSTSLHVAQQGTMVKTNRMDMEAKKAAAAKREFELRGKPPEPAEPTQQGVEKTSRQRVLNARKAAEKEKRAGKAVASSSRDEEEEEPAPPKKAKMSKGKGIAVERDRSKTPTVEELHHYLAKGVSWVPTRFADTKIMEELGIEDDVRTMLQHMKMESFYSMAYPTYVEPSSQFLATLEASFYEANHVRYGWGKIKFKVNGKNYFMSFKEIGAMMGLEDNEDQTLPRFKKLPTGVWRVISGNLHAIGHDKNSAIRHPAVRYLHRILVHTLYPRKEAGTVNEEELCLLYRAVKDNVTPEQLEEFEETDKMKFPTTNIFERFGMVGLFVERLMYYKNWVLEFPLEFLEVLGSIWDQKGSGKCCLSEQSTKAGYGSDLRHPLQVKRRQRDLLHQGEAPAPSPTSCRQLSLFGATWWSDVPCPRAV